MRIGVDVGGTNTDAVLMNGPRLITQAKSPTTEDVTSGIVSALEVIIGEVPKRSATQAIMLGTTHFTNALLERKNLSRTAILRLALPATSLLPPLVDWPQDMSNAIGGYTYLVPGGHEFDGSEIASFDDNAVRKAARDMLRKGVSALAISGVFSPVNPSHEKRAAAIINQEAPDIRISLSHEIGRLGLLERENAAAYNACLLETAERTINSIRTALLSLGLQAPLYLSQNDGTLMDVAYGERFPVLAISSGPTNSMRGAAFLSGIENGIVVDIGGTSTDVGALVNGFPREASIAVNLAGVRTNFRMPDVLSIALGGGSVVKQNPLTIGPSSVGFALAHEALVFGGKTLTSTDIAVAGSFADIGDKSLVQSLETSLVTDTAIEIRRRIERVVDQMKLNANPVPVILVGGGNILVGNKLEGASQVIRPKQAEVANAIGAAIAQVGGEVEKVYALDGTNRLRVLEEAKAEATTRAVTAGADPNTITVVEIEEIPLTYLPSNAVRVRVKVVGDLVGM